LTRVISWTVGRIDEEADDDFGYYGDVDVGEEDELQVAVAEARAALLQGVEGRASDVSPPICGSCLRYTN
jgi:hypothetical protein